MGGTPACLETIYLHIWAALFHLAQFLCNVPHFLLPWEQRTFYPYVMIRIWLLVMTGMQLIKYGIFWFLVIYHYNFNIFLLTSSPNTAIPLKSGPILIYVPRDIGYEIGLQFWRDDNHLKNISNKFYIVWQWKKIDQFKFSANGKTINNMCLISQKYMFGSKTIRLILTVSILGGFLKTDCDD